MIGRNPAVYLFYQLRRRGCVVFYRNGQKAFMLADGQGKRGLAFPFRPRLLQLMQQEALQGIVVKEQRTPGKIKAQMEDAAYTVLNQGHDTLQLISYLRL